MDHAFPGRHRSANSFNLDLAKLRKKGELPPMANVSVDLKV